MYVALWKSIQLGVLTILITSNLLMHSYSVCLIFAENLDNIEHESTTGTKNLLIEPMTSYIIYLWKVCLIIEKLYLHDRAINSSFGKYQVV